MSKWLTPLAFLVFIVTPVVELGLLLWVGAQIGPLGAFALVLLTGVLGASLARQQGFSVLAQLAEDSRKGVPPADRIAEGVLILVGGLLLLTPGLITDAAGFALVIPPTRRWLAPRVLGALTAAVVSNGVVFTVGDLPPSPRPQRPFGPRPSDDDSSPFDHPVA